MRRVIFSTSLDMTSKLRQVSLLREEALYLCPRVNGSLCLNLSSKIETRAHCHPTNINLPYNAK
jgi:hypothetical protein